MDPVHLHGAGLQRGAEWPTTSPIRAAVLVQPSAAPLCQPATPTVES
ncbi:hypothetical protein [Ornithinimicrobium kibberense]